jgi:hypothetical protein
MCYRQAFASGFTPGLCPVVPFVAKYRIATAFEFTELPNMLRVVSACFVNRIPERSLSPSYTRKHKAKHHTADTPRKTNDSEEPSIRTNPHIDYLQGQRIG